MKKPTIGIQLFTLRNHIQNAEDFDKTLDRLSKLGVKDVQISAIGDFPAEVQGEILRKYGMNVCVTHKPIYRMIDDLDTMIEEHKAIGCDAMGIGAPPEDFRGSAENVREFIAHTKKIGEKLKENGMTFNYHNHHFEFTKLGDMNCTMMDLLMEETDPETFKFILDVAWVHYADRNPAELLRQLKGRIKVIHFKDYIIEENRERKFVSLGRGVVNLKECYDIACELEIPYIMYEQDCDWTDDDAFKSVEESWEYLKSLQK